MAMVFWVFVVVYKYTTTTTHPLFFNCYFEKVMFSSRRSWCGFFYMFSNVGKNFFVYGFASLVNANSKKKQGLLKKRKRLQLNW
jgi:hypothetical protein